MAKYTSNRLKNLKIGISSYSENLQSLSVIGRVGIGSTNFYSGYDLDIHGTTNITQKLFVNGYEVVGGIGVTAANLNSLFVSGISTLGNIQINSGIVTSTSGITTFAGNLTFGLNNTNLISILGRIDSDFYPNGDGLYNIGRAPQIGFGANRWKDANFSGKGTFDSGIYAHDLEIGVSLPNLIYSTYGNLELNSQGGTTKVDDNLIVSGNLGINTTTATSKLTVFGNSLVTGIVTATEFYGSGSNLTGLLSNAVSTSSTTSVQYVGFLTTNSGISTSILASSGLTYVPSTGNLGIGTENPTSKIHVVGNTYISGILTATDINSASDIRLKTNIKPFENSLNKIIHVNGVTFNWIENNLNSAGIIAQDLEKVFPELVHQGDIKTVNYNGLVGVLVECIKELKKEVDELKHNPPKI